VPNKIIFTRPKFYVPFLLALAVLAALAAPGFYSPSGAQSKRVRFEQDVEQVFTNHEDVRLDSQTAAQRVRESGRLSVQTPARDLEIILSPNDLRAPNYRAEEVIDGGIVRGVRSVSGGVPRSTAGGGAASAAAAQDAFTRTPGAHVRVTFARPEHPIAYGYPSHTHVFRQNFQLYSVPRAWLRMAYCTTCLDGPEDRSGIVMEWGDSGGAPFLISGQVWGEGNILGRPAILDMPTGRGHVVAFNFNPFHRDMNRGDHRLVWNAILNWQAIVSAPAPKHESTSDGE